IRAVADLTRLLLEARRALAEALAGDHAPRGSPVRRPGHAALLLVIDRRTGSRLTDMAAASRLTKQAMMALVDDLESHGYVRRVADPSDTRAKLVRLTARGRGAATECRRAVQTVEQRTRRQLGDRSYDELRGALEVLAGESEE
ncbi:MAG: MarR family winged helix-turn-helix transcriptional regulator, partial [Actinomycetota bacterium]